MGIDRGFNTMSYTNEHIKTVSFKGHDLEGKPAVRLVNFDTRDKKQEMVYQALKQELKTGGKTEQEILQAQKFQNNMVKSMDLEVAERAITKQMNNEAKERMHNKFDAKQHQVYDVQNQEMVKVDAKNHIQAKQEVANMPAVDARGFNDMMQDSARAAMRDMEEPVKAVSAEEIEQRLAQELNQLEEEHTR